MLSTYTDYLSNKSNMRVNKALTTFVTDSVEVFYRVILFIVKT